MTRDDAERIIARLDNLEARTRDIEVGMKRIRLELQDKFKISSWDHNVRVGGDVMPQHGVNCPKAEHMRPNGYLHAATDDTPYDVDGLPYCGRCHGALT